MQWHSGQSTLDFCVNKPTSGVESTADSDLQGPRNILFSARPFPAVSQYRWITHCERAVSSIAISRIHNHPLSTIDGKHTTWRISSPCVTRIPDNAFYTSVSQMTKMELLKRRFADTLLLLLLALGFISCRKDVLTGLRPAHNRNDKVMVTLLCNTELIFLVETYQVNILRRCNVYRCNECRASLSFFRF